MSVARERLAREITEAIDASGLTQTAVAEEVGVKQSTVSAWMLGKAVPEITTMKALAALLKADESGWVALKLETLETHQRRGRKPAPTPGAPRRTEPAALSGKIDRLTPTQRAAIEAIVDEMLPE